MNDEHYSQGVNKVIKAYFYLTSGVGILNEFRNLFLGVFALYFTLKLENPIWLGVMFLVCVPVLAVIGYINVHKISPVRDWLSTKFGTHYGIKQFDYTKRQTELLEEIKEKL